MTALPETPETVLDALERQVARCDVLLAEYVAEFCRGTPKAHTSRRPWSAMVPAPTLAALCVLARAAIASIEDLSPQEAAAVETLERES